VPELTADAEARLQAHAWPGNVRELENVMQRALVLRVGERITAGEIHFESIPCANANLEVSEQATTGREPEPAPERLEEDLRRREADIILSALESGGSRVEVARRLGISPRTLRYKLARLREAGIQVPA